LLGGRQSSLTFILAHVLTASSRHPSSIGAHPSDEPPAAPGLLQRLVGQHLSSVNAAHSKAHQRERHHAGHDETEAGQRPGRMLDHHSP
jgi:hypothetical protein